MITKLLIGLALLLVAEGLMPFVNPNGFRRYMARITQLPDSTLRAAGLASMVLGLLLLIAVSA